VHAPSRSGNVQIPPLVDLNSPRSEEDEIAARMAAAGFRVQENSEHGRAGE